MTREKKNPRLTHMVINGILASVTTFLRNLQKHELFGFTHWLPKSVEIHLEIQANLLFIMFNEMLKTMYAGCHDVKWFI